MFIMSAAKILFLGLCLFWINYSAAQKSHFVWIDRVEPSINKEWIGENYTIEVTKINKTEKHMDVIVTTLKDINKDILCEMKTFQKMGGKYVKSAIDYPKNPCCGFIESAKTIWSCIKKFSNLPEECPISKGTIQMKNFSANECDINFQSPPNLPENYKAIFQVFQGPIRIIRLIIYGTMKKKFPF